MSARKSDAWDDLLEAAKLAESSLKVVIADAKLDPSKASTIFDLQWALDFVQKAITKAERST